MKTGLYTSTKAVTFNETNDVNAPVLRVDWPTNNAVVSGSNFTLQAQVDDPTATITATITDTNGDTNVISGMVERTGVMWVEGLPLYEGTNYLTLDVTNAAGYSSETNIYVVKSDMTLTMNPLSDPSQLWNATVSVSGTISDPSAAVYVNGVQGVNNGDGTWNASDVPVSPGGVASFDLKAIPAGGGDPDSNTNQDKPTGIYIKSYHPKWNSYDKIHYIWEDGRWHTGEFYEWALPVMAREHCSVNNPPPQDTDYYSPDSDIVESDWHHDYTRNADTVMHLRTGGKGKLQNLWKISGSASHVLDPRALPGGISTSADILSETIPSQNITVMGQSLGADGYFYKKLPDNDDVDITPHVDGDDFYTYDVGAQEYHCYFTAYAEEPNPGGGKWKIYAGRTEGFGHSWWSFSTDAPTEGLQAAGVPYVHYIGGAVGYFPIDWSIWLTLVDCDGILEYPNGGGNETVHRRREIGINGLINGLIYTEAVGAYPDEYDVFDQNCTTVAIKAGKKSGVSLPDDIFPQNFGIDLSTMPPDE